MQPSQKYYYHYPHFTDKETEAQKSEVIFSKSHSERAVERGSEPGQPAAVLTSKALTTGMCITVCRGNYYFDYEILQIFLKIQ